MAEDFDAREAAHYQESIINDIRRIERMIDTEIIDYYSGSRINTAEDARKHLGYIHYYLKEAWHQIDDLLTSLDRKI